MWYIYKTAIDEQGKLTKQLINTYDSLDQIPNEVLDEVDYAIQDNDHGESSYRGSDL